MDDVCVAFKAHMGWLNAVAVRCRSATVDCLDARRVDLVSGGERELLEPYHVAGGWQGLTQGPRPHDAAGIIRRGRLLQAQSALSALGRYRTALHVAGLDWRRAVLFTARGRLPDDLERVLASHAQIHVAEGEAIRDAARQALGALHLECVEQDEKAVPELAAAALPARDPDALLRSARPPGVAAWRKEERLLALGAWLHRQAAVTRRSR